MKRRYKERSHISDAKIREIIHCFSIDLTATNTAKLTGISRQTINKYFDRFRQAIFLNNHDISCKEGIFELDDHEVATKSILLWSKKSKG